MGRASGAMPAKPCTDPTIERAIMAPAATEEERILPASLNEARQGWFRGPIETDARKRVATPARLRLLTLLNPAESCSCVLLLQSRVGVAAAAADTLVCVGGQNDDR